MSDRIDSRDLLNEIRDLLEDPRYDYTDDPSSDAETWPAWAELSDDDRERISAVRAVLNELPESTVDSPHGNSWGCTLVPADEFEDYARELAEDTGAISGDESWPLSCIDWAKAADMLHQDYTEIELDGTTYYAR